MSEKSLVLTFDCGTQSFRAVIFNQKGELLAKEQHFFPPFYSLHNDWFEQKPEVYVTALQDVSQLIHKNNPELIKKVAAITITTIRDTCVCVDKSGQPVRDIISWLDQRHTPFKKPMRFTSRVAFALAGMTEAVNDQRKITKSNWIIKYEPDIWAKTYKYLMLSGYFVHLLTGEFKDSMASQIGHIPFDYKKKKWYKTSHYKWPIFNVHPDKLPELVDPGSPLGYITKKASKLFGLKEGLPLIATGSDKGCETLGVGVLNNQKGSISFGSAASIQLSIQKYIEPSLFMPCYPGVVNNNFNPEIQIFRGYWMVSWFKNEFATQEVQEAPLRGVIPEEILNENLDKIPPGSDGLILQPYWAPPLKNPEAKGSVIGFSGVHTKAHLYKAVIEGINFGLIDGLKTMERRTRIKASSIAISGGGSQSDTICQITADMFGRSMYKIQTYEACSLGSSIIGYMYLKAFNSYEEALEKMVHPIKTFTPNLTNYKIYQDLYKHVYTKIYQSLKPTYWKIRRLQENKEKKEL